jgi:hypothetical protein
VRRARRHGRPQRRGIQFDNYAQSRLQLLVSLDDKSLHGLLTVVKIPQPYATINTEHKKRFIKDRIKFRQYGLRVFAHPDLVGSLSITDAEVLVTGGKRQKRWCFDLVGKGSTEKRLTISNKACIKLKPLALNHGCL